MDQTLYQEALKAYGIDPKYVLAKKVYKDSGDVVIVTKGGSKVRFAKGMEVEPLEPIQVDGVIRRNFRSITGGNKEKKKRSKK